MKQTLKNRLQLEYPDISFYVEGIDTIPFFIYNKITYAGCYHNSRRIYILNSVDRIAHTPEELKAVFYHEIGHLIYPLCYPENIRNDEYGADNYAAIKTNWQSIAAVIEHIIKEIPRNQTLRDRLARAHQFIQDQI